MNSAYLLLGSNLGSREKHLCQAIGWIERSVGRISSKSALYRTAPWGNPEQDDFINQAISVETALSAEQVLFEILSIEQEMGRLRRRKWEARIIDIDILFFNSEIIQTPGLMIPHPALHLRRFVLVPLAEIARNLVHPALKKTVNQLLIECPDSLSVERF